MVGMVVAQDDVADVGEIDLQLLSVTEDGLLARARVEQEPVAIDFDQGGETPLPDAVGVGQHRGEDRDLDGVGAPLGSEHAGRRDEAPGEREGRDGLAALAACGHGQPLVSSPSAWPESST